MDTRPDLGAHERATGIRNTYIGLFQADDAGIARLLPELNMASLRAAGHFLEKLELKSLDNPAGDEASHVVNRVFIRYSNLITRTLSFGRTLPVVSCVQLVLGPRSDAMLPQFFDHESPETSLTSLVCIIPPLPAGMPDTHHVPFLAPRLTTRSRDPRACRGSALPPN